MGFDEIEAPDIVLVSHRGDVIAGVGAPDDESAIGVWAMSDWPMIRAVVHVHSLYAAAFSSTDAASTPFHMKAATSFHGCCANSFVKYMGERLRTRIAPGREGRRTAARSWNVTGAETLAVRWPWLSISRSRVDSN